MFTIITPTYKRKEFLMRAITSVKAQAFEDWEMIIVNDSPEDTSYEYLDLELQDHRIRYVVNEVNSGVNHSRNRALDMTSLSSWVIFLDDDDYLSPDALTKLSKLIETHPDEQWIMTNRAYSDGKKVTHAPKNNHHYAYAEDILLGRKIKGDPTHCIKAKAIDDIRFPKSVKQAEEWLFFYQLGKKTDLYYIDENITITEGYAHDGLNFRKRTKSEKLKTLYALFKESYSRKLFPDRTLIFYFLIRTTLALIK